MQYQVLPPFVFGFLLTVFPRWLGLEALPRTRYVPVGLGLFGGQLLALAGLCGAPWALQAGLVLGFAGWTFMYSMTGPIAWYIALDMSSHTRASFGEK